MRLGFGYDSHRFTDRRPLLLGGVLIPDSPGLEGFSDGDAVAHAVTDALLGAAALGDIGTHFPPGIEDWRDADSMDLLRRSVDMIHRSGFRVGNVDLTIICEHPRIGPSALAIRQSLARALSIEESAVSVKGKSNETMGWEGNREGLAVHAVALLVAA